MGMSLAEAVASRLPHWKRDPVVFDDEALGRKFWSKQAEIARAVRVHPRVTVRSGHKTGKSCVAACIGIDWCALKPGSLCIITAPTNRQVEEVIWHEVHEIFRTSPIPLGGHLYDSPSKGWRGPDGTRLIGFSTDDPNNYSGPSGKNKNVLVIADEAAGIKQKVLEAIKGSLAGGAHLLYLGNPTELAGDFYDSHHSMRAFWKQFHLSSMELRNRIDAGLEPDIDGLARRPWIDEHMALGEDNPIVQVRVFGNFPTEGTNVIIGIALVEKAREARHTTEAKGPLRIGVDCARYGDDQNAIQPRRGKYLYPQDVFGGQDTIAIANRVLGVVRALRQHGDKPRIMVDEIGVGAGVFDQLAHVSKREAIEVIPINVSTTSDDPEKYTNLRSQLWFGCRDWLRDGGMLDDPKLEAELIAPHFKYDNRGRYQVESKDEIKERLGRSPDRADALCNAVYEGGFTPHGVRLRGL